MTAVNMDICHIVGRDIIYEADKLIRISKYIAVFKIIFSPR